MKKTTKQKKRPSTSPFALAPSSRPPMERMFKIHQLLTDGTYPNKTKLAAIFETSTKTIERDLDFMIYRMHLPIEYCPKKHGYYYTKPVKNFPGYYLSEQELFAVCIANQALAQYEGTPFFRPLRDGFKKVMENLDAGQRYFVDGVQGSVSFRPLAPAEIDPEVFKSVAQAARERRAIKFVHRKLNEPDSKLRHVQPWHIACVADNWYLFCHDCDRAAFRTFAIDRMSHVLITDETFPDASFNLKKELEGSWTVLSGTGSYDITLGYDLFGSDLIRNRRWHRSQQIVHLANHLLQLKLHLTSLEEIVRWVLSWGRHVTSIDPPELRQRVHEEAKIVADRFASKPPEPTADDWVI